MMNRFIYLFLLLGCTASALVGCTDDPNVDPLPAGSVGKDTAWVTIDFCDNSFDEVNITTRATLNKIAESRVGNLFVFIFGPKDDTGNAQRLYGRYFDFSNRVDTADDLADSQVECWWVEGNASTQTPHGKVRIIAPEISGGTLYLLANVNADMVNISPDKLRFVQTLDDMNNLTATLNQAVTERNGFFPMTGLAEKVSITRPAGQEIADITADGVDITMEKENAVQLTRLDAKVTVQVRVAEGYSAYSGETEEKTKHTINSFVPLSWQVVNLPRTTFVLPHDTDAKDEKGKKEMFHTREVKFETRESSNVSYKYTDRDGNTHTVENKPTVAHGFSFYMLENRPDPTTITPVPLTEPNPDVEADMDRLYEGWGYNARDTRRKDKETGAYLPDDGTGNIWKYAPAEGTYLVIKGEIVMALNLDDEAVNQQLSADVVYYIHLGDFGGEDTNGDGKISVEEYGDGLNNYNIERNTSYTYTITIYGVDNIQVEVEKQRQENESGATGHVYVAKEQIYTFDSHYGSEVVSFDEKHLTDLDQMTWYVRTPFGREGKPYIINGVEVPSGLDYQWVKFKINSINNDGSYSHLHEKYHPKQVMDILEFSKYIKAQKQAFIEGKENAFRREFDKVWLDWYNKEHGTNISEEDARKDLTGDWYRNRIYLTIFVDEFYYDANPLTGDVRQDLWKDFVNQPHRLMHILCDAEKSADEASLSTGSVVTIRQRSIQTIFNTEKPELMTAWGSESIDETRDKLWYYSPTESYSAAGFWVPPTDGTSVSIAYGNNSQGNGLFNSAKLWWLFDASGDYILKEWDDYVDPDADYDLCEEYRTLRYSCMTRNRDENGNNTIDAKELKWYMAAISQLGSLYVGDQGLSTDAVLYPHDKQLIIENKQDASNAYTWRAHIVSSTAYNNGGYPEIMWAEEGLSTGPYDGTWGKAAGLTVRCVRNLGMDPVDETDARKKLRDEKNMPAQAIRVKGPGIDENGSIIKDATISDNAVYEFDLTNLNPLSIRYYTSQELEPNNEHSVEARTYWAFETGAMSSKEYYYSDLFDLIRDGKSPCPEGYRTPNVREGALMSLRCHPNWRVTDSEYDQSRVSTYYSHGNKKLETKNGSFEIGTGQDQGVTDDDGNVTKPNHSWIFSTDRVRIDENASVKVRCVRDVRQ